MIHSTVMQIMAQLGMLVPARSARLVPIFPKSKFDMVLLVCLRMCPVDAILTRMGAYDNMFSNASTFKVELDEWYVQFVTPLAWYLRSCVVARSSAMPHQNHSSSSTVYFPKIQIPDLLLTS
jgi:hypothetical protein